MVTVAAGVAIAGWFASTIISKLIDKAPSYFKDQKEWKTGMKDEVKRLSDSQIKIMTLVDAAERGSDHLRGAQIPALEKWLGKLRDAVEEADNVLDELEYQRLNPEADGSVSEKLKKMIKKVGMRVVQQDDVLKRLREVVKTFDNLVDGLGTFAQVLSLLDGRIATEVSGDMGRETGSLFTENEFIGREKEKHKVIQWLKKTDTKIISVFSIVGVGGVGKTALTQNLFDHPGLDFQIKIWVWVSTSFEEKAIIMKILEVLTKEKQEYGTLEVAQRTLIKKMNGQKFLLVLDDVWNDKEKQRWNKVMTPLKYGSEGSKILVTTRMESVADTVAKVVGENKMSLNLDGLEETDNVKLFEKYAFVGFTSNEHTKLQSIGNKIASKLMGIPLSVKTVGGMLNDKLEVKYWNRVLEDGALNSDKGTDGIMSALRFSYEHLQTELKPCFRYCSIFPDAFKFDRDRLVDMWISVGLIPEGETSQEELANEFFETLVRKSFFEHRASYYGMHDLLHELAQVLSKNECLRVVSNDPIQITQSIRHLSLWTNNILVLKNLSELNYLRTLWLICDIDDAELADVINTALKRLKTIRYLELKSNWLCIFPKSIGELIHLRCLRIKRTPISELSRCICTLYHLQILEFTMKRSFHQVSIPADICNLSKLKRLDIPSKALSTIPHIGKLRSLQQLIGYSVKGETGYDISELEMMSELRKLEIINLENVKSTKAASKAQLNSKQHLLHIQLKWGGFSEEIGGRNETDKDVSDCFEPHRNLTDLSLSDYRATNLPNWLAPQILPNLTTIMLGKCNSLERLPPFGQLSYLKFLSLRDMGALKEIGLEFYGSSQSGNSFPSLETLDLSHLVQLKEWREDTESEVWFPHLKRLVLFQCPGLKILPPIPTALRNLELNVIGTTKLPGFKQKNEESSTNQNPLSLSSLQINGWQKLTSMRSGLLMHPKQLKSLEKITIYQCDNLEHLPSEGFREFISLKSLEIAYCKRIFFLPSFQSKNFFPPSLQWLKLRSCGDLAMSLPELLQGLSLLSSLELENCNNIISLPPANVLQSLTSLKELEIRNCQGLKFLGGLEAIPFLKVLVIRKCLMLAQMSPLDSIEESPRNKLLSMALSRLEIDQPELLLVVPLRNLHLTKSLEIRGSNGIKLLELPEQWLLQNEASLQSLVLHGLHQTLVSLQNLKKLRLLHLYEAYQLTRLPELPRSLEILKIDGCREELARRLGQDGLDYDKIRHLNVVVSKASDSWMYYLADFEATG